MYKLKHYIDPEGQNQFTKWLNSLKDKQALSKIAARLLRLENVNFGDCKPVGEGVWELRIDRVPATECTTLFKANELSCFVTAAIKVLKRQI